MYSYVLILSHITWKILNDLSHCAHINEPHFTKKLIKIMNIKKKVKSFEYKFELVIGTN